VLLRIPLLASAPKRRYDESRGHTAHADQDVPVAERIHERDLRTCDVVDDQPGDTEQPYCDKGWRYPASTRWRLDLFWLRLPPRFLLLLLGCGLSRSRLGHQILLALEVGSVVKDSGRDLMSRHGR
jgi:hypothetical protein